MSLPSEKEATLELCQMAIDAAKHSYSPYSNYPVGAALCSDAGVFTGCNIENASYGLSICAERCTLCKAVSSGAKKIFAMAIVCAKSVDEASSPCGACRQFMVEFGNYDVYLVRMGKDGKFASYEKTSSYDLLPNAFLPTALAQKV